MTQKTVSQRYTEMAELYADLFCEEVSRDATSMAMLADLVDHARPLGSTVLDVGCGPGHVTQHLAELGAVPIGIEPSVGMLAQARARFPKRNFCRGDLRSIGVASARAAGLVSRFSTIHLPPAELPAVFAEYARVLAPGGTLIFWFFAADEPEQHGDAFDHKVATAYRVDTDTAAAMLADAGFIETGRSFTPADNRRSNASLTATR